MKIQQVNGISTTIEATIIEVERKVSQATKDVFESAVDKIANQFATSDQLRSDIRNAEKSVDTQQEHKKAEESKQNTSEAREAAEQAISDMRKMINDIRLAGAKIRA